MPEGDTVYLAVKRMTGALRGKCLVHGELRPPRLAEHDLSGLTVLGARSAGSTCSPVSMTGEACYAFPNGRLLAPLPTRSALARVRSPSPGGIDHVGTSSGGFSPA